MSWWLFMKNILKSSFRTMLGFFIGALLCVSYEFIVTKEISFYTIRIFTFLFGGVLIGSLIRIIFYSLNKTSR